MLILSIDTSTAVGSVALIKDDKVLREKEYTTKGSHAEVLLKNVDELLKKCKLDISDIDGFGVAIGPGSFTGLRIGLATAKGLALASNKPIVGISTLKALFFSLRSCERTSVRAYEIVPCINAYRNEVYTFVEGVVPESSVSPEELCEKLLKTDRKYVFIGDGAVHYKELFKKLLCEKFVLADEKEVGSIAASVGLLALQEIKNNKGASISLLAPNYIRKSDAEIKLGSH